MQRVIAKMAHMYPMLVALGAMIVVVAFIIGFFNSQTAAAYFGESKIVRETTLMSQRAAIESVGLWLPYFKFLGLGLILGGIVMALRVILDNLKAVGEGVLANVPREKRPVPPKPPWYGLLMPLVMMLGVLILIAALGISLQLAATARVVFANPLPVIDAGGTGSALLTQLQTIYSVSAWLVPLKFVGIVTHFSLSRWGWALLSTP